MTKEVETVLLQDIAAIKNAIIGSEYGPGLINDHKETKARTFENKRAITRDRTFVYAITSTGAFLYVVITIIKNWNSILG